VYKGQRQNQPLGRDHTFGGLKRERRFDIVQVGRPPALDRGVEAQLGAALAVSVPAKPLRIPILRETRMPAVWCRLGPPSQMVQQAPAVAGALREILTAWCREPIR